MLDGKQLFVVMNAAHNDGPGESDLLVSSLSVVIILLVVAAMFVVIDTDGQSKVTFVFSPAHWRVPH